MGLADRKPEIDHEEAFATLAGLASLVGLGAVADAARSSAQNVPHAPVTPGVHLAEARYRALVEQIPAVTFTASLAGGANELYVSPQIQTLLGFTQDEWLSDPVLWFRQLHPEDRETLSHAFAQACLTGSPLRGVCRALARDGRTVWVAGEARFVRDELGRPSFLQGVAFDITEQRNAQETEQRLLQEQLARQEADAERARLHEIFKGLPAAITVVRGPKHVIEFFNPLGSDFLGAGAEAIGKPWREAVPSLEREAAVLDRVLESGEPFVGTEWVLSTPVENGQRYFNFVSQPLRGSSGGFSGVLTHAVEVTEQVRARKATEAAHEMARAAEERLTLAIESAAMGTWDLDVRTGAFAWDARCKAILACSATLVDLRRFLDAIHPEDRPGAEEALREALEPHGSGNLKLECRISGIEDGTERWISARAQAIFEGERATRLVGTLLDSTEPRRAARERDRLIEQLQQTLMFSELFVGILGHDLRNPLNSIMTTASLMVRQRESETVVRQAGRIVRSADRMARMIDQILDFTRIRLGTGLRIEPRPVDAREVVKSVVDEFETIHAGGKIEVSHQGETTGRWDPDRLAQLLSNLVGNALQHRREQSPIHVVLDGSHRDHVRLSVHNEGAVPSELLPVLFEPFRGTGDKKAGRGAGLGLGLFISQQIVVAHGGTIDVDSSPELGTTMSILLPRDRGVHGTARVIAAEARKGATG
jgi:PAS domain S-box-containing protein